LRIWITITAPFGADERGQTTTEYALVMMAAAAVAGMLLAWATKGHAISHLFDVVIEKAMP
jgi:Flp pilus assembly pilin Flp